MVPWPKYDCDQLLNLVRNMLSIWSIYDQKKHFVGGSGPAGFG
jgi:hypothetical protein